MWANENWTRTWDGLENDVLIKQDYLDADEDNFIADTGAYMADSRYVRLNDQPLFILYRPGLLPEPEKTINRWRKKWAALLGETPLVMMVQGFGDEDPRDFGLDGAVEFPPHKVCAGLDNINDQCHVLDSNYQGLVRDYASVVDNALREEAPAYPLIKTVSPHWDNDARREGRGMTMHGSTPALYEKWLRGAMDFAELNPVGDESLVFINAWNEWAEGAYLEPDVHYGHAYLNATKRASKSLPVAGDTNRILLVGHDACKHGAQMLLLNMAKVYVRQFGMDVVVLLKEGGPLLAEYQRIAPTHVVSKLGKNGLKKLLTQHQFKTAICNTSVTGDLVPVLRKHGLQVVSLIHEMPNLIRDYRLESQVESIARSANYIVYAAQPVKSGFEEFAEHIVARQIIRPQGTYTRVDYDDQVRTELRESLGIKPTDQVVLGVGYADLRKGFDLFMESARRLTSANESIHFIWAGALSADMERWIRADFSQRKENVRIHVVGFTERVKDYYSVADCLYLSSREDPYPTVVLEAMHVGLPVISYRGTTGFDELMETYGYLVEYGDAEDLDNTIAQAVTETDTQQSLARQDYVEQNCQFDDYCFSLLEILHPCLKRVSVVVPNYNYEPYIEQRLSSIFVQNYPIFEVLFLDDGSSDNSVAVAERVARRAKRDVQIISSENNSGSVFRQWRAAVELARGKLLWIAEADDSADARFIDSMVNVIYEHTVFAYCDSKQIDEKGKHLSKSYQHYFAQSNPGLFKQNFELPGDEFALKAMAVRNNVLNVSGVIWERERLSNCITHLIDEIDSYQLVGDWRIYMELLNQPEAKIAFVAEALNIHRRHDASVTGSLSAQQHVDEIAAMHRYALANLPVDKATQGSMEDYLSAVSTELQEQQKQDFPKAA